MRLAKFWSKKIDNNQNFCSSDGGLGLKATIGAF